MVRRIVGLGCLGFLAISAVLSTVPEPLGAQQTGGVQGLVRGTLGNPLPGTQVYLEGGAERYGVLTDGEGRYHIQNVPAGTYTAVAQFIGYATVRNPEVEVPAGASITLDFTLATEVLQLSELVVTGVTEGTQRAMVPFTVGRVSAEDLPAPPRDAVSSLQGRVAGVNIVSPSGPGETGSLLLRTPTSINGNNEPMVVVDGVILSASSVDISSLDIESMEIVKGASAASLYGSRAAAGVINIRTARGSSLPTDATRLTFRTEYGTSDIPRPIQWATRHNFRQNEAGEYLDASGAVVPRHLAAVEGFGIQDRVYPGPIHDQVGSLFSPGAYTSNSASIGYNGESTSWIATAGMRDEEGVVLGNDGYRRYDFRLNLDHAPRDDLRMAVSVSHMRSTRDILPGNTFFDFIHIAPDVDLLQPDEDGTPYIFQPDEGGIRVNPLYRIHTQMHEDQRLRTLAGLDLRYSPLHWISVDLNASYDRSDRDLLRHVPKGVKTPNYPSGDPGQLSRENQFTDGMNASLGTVFTRHLDGFSARLTLRGLIERQSEKEFTASGQDLAVGGIGELGNIRIPAVTSGSQSIRSSGYFANLDLDHDQTYIFTGLVRRDGSSLFGPEDRWHTYYRVSTAYRMAQEEWWPFENVGEFKLRYSRGTAGGRPGFSNQYETFSIEDGGGLSLSTLGNRALRPEKSTEQEFGVDLALFNRFSAEFTYARQRTVDQLVLIPLPQLYGFVSQWRNAGTVSGSTIEMTLESRMVERPGLRWTMTLLGDRSRNRIEEYGAPCHMANVGLGYRCPGEILGIMYGNRFVRSADELPAAHASATENFQVNDDGYLVPVGVGNDYRDGVASGLWGTNVTVDGTQYPWGRPILLRNEDGTAATVRIGDGNPDFKWGWGNQLQRGNLSLYVLVDGQVGGNAYNSTKQRMYQYARHGDVDQHGKPEELQKPVGYYAATLYNGNANVDWFMEDASYVKLREISLRYFLDSQRIPAISRLGFSRATLSVIARNLHTWTDYSGYDPEIGSVLNRNDNFSYPIYRTLTASVELQF